MKFIQTANGFQASYRPSGSALSTFQEIIMPQSPKEQAKKMKHTKPASEDSEKAKHQAEQREVAGRHKNDGQKDHKGAR